MLPWKASLAGRAQSLLQSLAAVAPDDFATALDAEIYARTDAFLTGLERYRRHPYRRRLTDPPVLWQEGTTRLLDYGPPGATPVLVVPSLINRAYILDLAPGKSLLRHLAGAGLRPLLVDWGRPGEAERGFTLDDYIAGRLKKAAAAAAAEAAPGLAGLAVLGYCMGGLLAVALAQLAPQLVRALALLATPWDFHADRAAQARVLGILAEPVAASCALLGEIPVDVLQTFFAALDPLLTLRKFTRFGGLEPDSDAARAFVALEDWANDGVPLALAVARECLGEWYGAGSPAAGRWRVAGVPIRPEVIDVPSLVILPANDRIVPPASAAALAHALPRAETLTPPLGHVGMIVGERAPQAVWQPLTTWLRRQGTVPAARRSGSQKRRG